MLIALLGLVAQLQWAGPSAGIITLNGSWRFQAGDSAAWSDPALDDTAWPAAAVPGAWPLADGSTAPRTGWYRLHLDIAETPTEPLGIRFVSIATAYEVYVDGVRVGGLGRFRPAYRPRTTIPVVYPLPPASTRAGTHVIAVRVYSEEQIGGITGRVELGPLPTLLALERNRDFLYLATAFILIGIGFTQVVFWLRRPHGTEHLFIFMFSLMTALFFINGMFVVRQFLEPWVYWLRLYLAFAAAAAAAFLYAFRRIFELDEDRLLGGIAIIHLLLMPFAIILPQWHQLSLLSRWFLNPMLLLAAGAVLVIAVKQLREGAARAKVVLWGTAVLGIAMLRDVLVDWGVLTTQPTAPWMTLGGTVVFVGAMALATAERFAESESAALYDRLTGLYRREVVLDALSREIRRSSRTRQPLAVIMLDVDKFKQINDTLGHQAGDRVLGEIGRRLGEAGRAVDWLGRYGGEEFMAVLASTTRDGAVQAAERLRSAVSALPIATGRTARTITLSAGVAAYEGQEEWPTTEVLIGAADAALYRAKNAGRDRVAD